jgi:PAS domain S-box-containing protein
VPRKGRAGAVLGVEEMSAIQSEDRPYAELVRQLYKHAPIGIAATLLNSLILTIVEWRVIPHSVLLSWFSTIAIVTFLRYSQVYRVHRSSAIPYEPGRVYAQLIFGIGLSGVLWGSAGIFLFADNSITHQVFLAFVLGGMVAGAAGTLSIVMTAFLIFSLPALSPITVRFFILGDEIHLAMGAMILLFWFMMFFTARRINAATIALFQLNTSLAEAKDRAEKLNEELKSEIGERAKAEEALQRHKEHLSEMVAERTAELISANAHLVMEIEERKRAEEAQRTSEQKYRTLVETTNDFVWEMDQNAVFTYASPKILDILGYEPDEILGKRCFELMPPEEASRIAEIFDSYGVSRKPFNLLEAICNHKGGYHVFWETSGIPIFDKEGEVCGYRGISRDISERKKVEEQLRESEEKYRHLVENINDVIFATSNDGVVTYISPTVEPMSGYRPSEIIGRHFSEFISPADLPRAAKRFEEVASGRLEPGEYRVLAASGGTLWVRISSNRLIMDGRFVGVQGVLTDITYRKEAEAEKDLLEAQLRQAQKMEALGTLAGGIAHDFNNILAVIIGYTEMMLTGASAGSPVSRDLQQVLNAANRAKDLVKQILVFSRMKGQQERVPVDIGIVIKEGLKLLRATLPATIEIRQNIANEAGMALADPSQIHEILIHLCTNAAHAMEEDGGVLEVTLSKVNFDAETPVPHPDMKPAPYLRLTVSDSGHGMDEATQERIFDPYFTTKQTGKGSGLGLALVHGIVRHHLGAITVQSEPGKGTTFHLYIPRIESQAKPEDSVTAPIPGGTERVLLVDDEESLLVIEQRMLERLGYSVLAKTSSIDALETFRGQPNQFDLVITDYTMPNMTGANLAREIVQIRADMPIVLCTGFSEQISEEKAKDLGITEFVLKPFELRTLAEAIHRALAKSK